MKKKAVGVTIISLIAIILIVFVNYLEMNNSNNKRKKLNKDFIYVTSDYKKENNLENGYVFTDYQSLNKNFTSNDIEKIDFTKNNYVLIVIKSDPCSEYNVTPTDYKINGNKIDVEIQYDADCGACAQEYIYYLLKVDKNMTYASINLNYQVLTRNYCDPNVAKKPIIYLYPEEETNVLVKLGNDNFLTTTYPKYNNGWSVYAYPNGKLIDNKTGRELYGLYWEGNNHNTKVKDEGFIVEGKDSIDFLEEKLSILGLTEREANEFIIYWLPELEKNKYNYIRFETEEEINNYMPLDITPTPDTTIRVIMDYKPLNKEIKVKEQTLATKERKGFTVVEWGGSKINN